MTPAARLQAAIEIVDTVIDAARGGGAPADVIVRDYFRTRRYAGSKDRRAVRAHVYAMIRRHAAPPPSGRAAALGLAADDPALAALFDGSAHAPAPIAPGEAAPAAGQVPDWLVPRLSPLVDASEHAALLERAPLDVRVNIAKATRDAVRDELGGEPTPLSPWGLRFAAETRLDDTPAFAAGRIEVQDEASQLVALACAPAPGARVLDLCAGAGGKSLALAAMQPAARLVAADVDKRRLGQLPRRAARAGAAIETLLLDPPREADALAPLAGQVDCLLVDAPCSGSGTWRRNPELRWRLTPERLDAFTAIQARLLALAAPLVRPGGRLVYATCSLLEAEGAAQVDAFLSAHSAWSAQDPLAGGRRSGAGRLFTPGHDATDGFFIACLEKG
ncbi:RsmB/NOP family class I SAM-dependent RNA methyltransferase [Sphingomicrobium astaxanthinifaciens]|uniref:RsmB/NOP family class I SAM-dependent RNA methyltransferase n=1 Tax=Sphingomicrobium astaxanthinifaciens TaxID=1227949 RepID=UPI001FCAB879|nr:RsmB/NOP family class I SAM-dependent RNA methyltransferase [Sphingomicrobium astaxanthinifaciens]MCJ7422211.1 RsmB/NOP family class I SAM-dependent RNA methyltransferase [Sphingomicrobium astaxanthinifaciens]